MYHVSWNTYQNYYVLYATCYVILVITNCQSNSELNFRLISIARLNTLLCVHLQPIVVASHREALIFTGSSSPNLSSRRTTKPSFVDSFTLICIQRLS